MEPEQVSDAELIVRVRSGDAGAMGELYARHSEAALRVARATSRDPHLAQDLVASAFERVHGAITRGAGPADSFRAYLYTVVRRLATEAGMLKARERDTDDWSPYEASTAIADDSDRSLEAQLVATAFSALPERQQAVLWYLEVEGMTPLQAAPLFGLSPNATSALAVRARDALRVAYIQAHVSDLAVHDDCAPTRRRMGAYLRSSLSARDATKVEAHLLECDECPLVLEELKDVGYGLKSVFGPILIGGALIGGVLAAASGGADGAMAAAAVAGGAATGSPSGGGNAAGQSKQATKFAAAAIGVLAALGAATVVSAAVSAPPSASAPAPAAPDAPIATASPSPVVSPSAIPTPTPTVPAPVVDPPVVDSPAPPAEPALDTPPVAALSLDFAEGSELPDGTWSGSVSVTVTNPNTSPIRAVLRVQLPEGVALDTARPLGGVSAWTCVLGNPLVCTAESIAVGGQVSLEVPVTIEADALGSRPVANVSVTKP